VTLELRLALQDERQSDLSERVRRLLGPFTGSEVALDSGCGTGALAFALAPLVREVVAVDPVPEALAEARTRVGDRTNVTFAEGDATKLPFAEGSFDVAGMLMVLHHLTRPELAMAELTRVTRLGGTVLVVDQVAPADPVAAYELNRFERARDPSCVRVLADADLRGLFESNSLVVVADEMVHEDRDLGAYLDRAGCAGEERERALGLAPREGSYPVTVGWYVLEKRPYGVFR
jgi:ubiquinone/menaquinone biosynthesis C-methylase UbiE